LRWSDPSRGDVVTFASPEDGRLMVKRVVGVPGDRVALTGNRLEINGTAADYRPFASVGDALEGGAGATPAACAASGFACYRERLLGSERVVRMQIDRNEAASRDFPPIRVPDGHYLMLGDNRDQSHDSRELGFVARDRIIGRVVAVAFSLDHANHFVPRTDRFFADLR
jgi:signal peptidase I